MERRMEGRCCKPEERLRLKENVEAFFEEMLDEFPKCAPTDMILTIETVLEAVDVVEKAIGRKTKKKNILSLDRVAKVMRENKDLLSCEGPYHGFDLVARKINYDGYSSNGLRMELKKPEKKEE